MDCEHDYRVDDVHDKIRCSLCGAVANVDTDAVRFAAQWGGPNAPIEMGEDYWKVKRDPNRPL